MQFNERIAVANELTRVILEESEQGDVHVHKHDHENE